MPRHADEPLRSLATAELLLPTALQVTLSAGFWQSRPPTLTQVLGHGLQASRSKQLAGMREVMRFASGSQTEGGPDAALAQMLR